MTGANGRARMPYRVPLLSKSVLSGKRFSNQMCRLMAFVSAQNVDFPQILGADFSEFVALSSFHKDGWGIAVDSPEQQELSLAKAPEQASESTEFESRIHQLHGTGGLLHLRWATSGLPNCDVNTHPFIFSNLAFIHNGDIRPREELDKHIEKELNDLRNGDTDSERYFYLLLTQIRKFGIVKGVQATIEIVRAECTYSSINAMLLTPEHLLIISEYNQDRIPANQPEDYYQLKYKNIDQIFLVASSGWKQESWTLIENGTFIIVNRNNLRTEIHPIS